MDTDKDGRISYEEWINYMLCCSDICKNSHLKNNKSKYSFVHCLQKGISTIKQFNHSLARNNKIQVEEPINIKKDKRFGRIDRLLEA